MSLKILEVIKLMTKKTLKKLKQPAMEESQTSVVKVQNLLLGAKKVVNLQPSMKMKRMKMRKKLIKLRK
jgi:hypothetical protein